MDLKAFGEAVRAARKKKGWSIARLTREMGREGTGYAGTIERNKVRNPGFSDIINLCAILCLDLADYGFQTSVPKAQAELDFDVDLAVKHATKHEKRREHDTRQGVYISNIMHKPGKAWEGMYYCIYCANLATHPKCPPCYSSGLPGCRSYEEKFILDDKYILIDDPKDQEPDRAEPLVDAEFEPEEEPKSHKARIFFRDRKTGEFVSCLASLWHQVSPFMEVCGIEWLKDE
jgi:transcriptional regulator with XRE-family HTH domain